MVDLTKNRHDIEAGPARKSRRPAARSVAAITLVFYGMLLLTAAALELRRHAGMATAPSWSLFHLVVTLALAIGLLRGQPWAWWGSLVLSVVALLLLMPLVTALLGGPGLTLLVPRADLVIVSLEAASLMFLLILLVQLRLAPPEVASGRR
jgi:hypothetical protein